MDRTSGLTADTGNSAGARETGCLECGSHLGLLPSVSTGLLLEFPLRRCPDCGIRATCEIPPRKVLSCSACKLFFVEEPTAGDRCPGCRVDGFPLDAPETSVVAATELEVRVALADAWTFVGASSTTKYLNRVLREVATAIDGAPIDGEVLLVDEARIRTLALPSGTVLLSVGALGALENVAALAFVLAHELAHAASGDATTAFVRVGLRQLAQGQRTDDREDWTQAALDLVRLGYGDSREYEADAQAIQALTLLDYDTDTVLQYFHRLRGAVAGGAPKIAESALAHPPPMDRLGRIESRRSSYTGSAGIRVNRDVFRRSAGHSVLTRELLPIRPFGEKVEAAERRPTVGGPKRTRILLGLLLLAGLLALLLLR